MFSDADAGVRAYTDSGKEVDLGEDGTWEYTGRLYGSEQEAYDVPEGVNAAVESLSDFYGIVYHSEKWKTISGQDIGRAEFGFSYKEGEGYGFVAFDDKTSDIEDLIRSSLSSPDLTDVEILSSEQDIRIVNGAPIMYIRIDARREDYKEFVWLAYLFAGPQGSVQFTTVSPMQEFQDNEAAYLDLLNGLILKNK